MDDARGQRSVNPRDLPPERLAEQCRWEAFRGSGPGGQKRNKTSSAVRVTHVPSGICVVASESRSQAQNKAAALQRLRRRLVFELRDPVASVGAGIAVPSPADARLGEMIGGESKQAIGIRSPDYLPAVARVLDVLADRAGSVSEAAVCFGITTARLVRFIQRDEELLAYVNRMRAAAGLRNLGGSRS